MLRARIASVRYQRRGDGRQFVHGHQQHQRARHPSQCGPIRERGRVVRPHVAGDDRELVRELADDIRDKMQERLNAELKKRDSVFILFD